MGQIIAIANWVKARALDVVGYQAAAAASVADAAAQVVLAEAQVTAAAAQVVLAENAAADAATAADDAYAAASAVMSNPATSGDSSTSTTLAAGSHTLTTDAGKSFGRGMWLTIFNDEDHFMQGRCTAYNGTTGAISVAVKADDVTGSGTFTSWAIGVGEVDAAGAAFVWSFILN